jgi:bifunctional DNase/RNase
MGTDEDAVEADLGSASMTRADDDGSAFVNDDPVATESATWTSDVTEVAEPDEPAEPAEPGVNDESDEPAELGERAEPGVNDEPDEPAELGQPADETDLAVDPLLTPIDMSQMLYVDVVLLLPATYPVVVLQEADPPFRELRIPVGGAEGIAIGYAARGLETPRPLTHELFTRVLEEFGMTLDVVRITAVRGTAFDAEMVISGRAGARLIDCRPSDAIALALRQQVPVPIMAASEVLESAGTDPLGAN